MTRLLQAVVRVGFLLLMLCAFSRDAAAQTTPFLGQTMTTGFNFCPTGWSTMQGQLLQISQNVALFSLLGTIYGGNGTTNFALPTALPIFTATGAPLLQCMALQGAYPSHP
jgi:microcystin-dependent protein